MIAGVNEYATSLFSLLLPQFAVDMVVAVVNVVVVVLWRLLCEMKLIIASQNISMIFIPNTRNIGGKKRKHENSIGNNIRLAKQLARIAGNRSFLRFVDI